MCAPIRKGRLCKKAQICAARCGMSRFGFKFAPRLVQINLHRAKLKRAADLPRCGCEVLGVHAKDIAVKRRCAGDVGHGQHQMIKRCQLGWFLCDLSSSPKPMI